MTDEEKNLILTPAINFVGCSGFTGSVPRLNFSGICLNDAESGVRTSDHEQVSGFPALLTTGATWDKGLAYLRGQHLGEQFKAKGVNVALGPVVGPLGRVVKGGRNWEGEKVVRSYETCDMAESNDQASRMIHTSQAHSSIRQYEECNSRWLLA